MSHALPVESTAPPRSAPPSSDVRRLIPGLLALNVADAVFTAGFVSLGLATEANPLLAPLLEGGVGDFVACKLALVGLGLALLWRHAGLRLAQLGTTALFTGYTVLLIVHLAGLHEARRVAPLLWQ